MHNNNFEKSLGIKCRLSVTKEDKIVGHIPFNLSPIIIISLFLKRDVNKAFARVTGSKSINELDMALKYPVFMNSMDQSPIFTSSGKSSGLV